MSAAYLENRYYAELDADYNWAERVDAKADELLADYQMFDSFMADLAGNEQAQRELHKLFFADPLEYHRTLHAYLLAIAKGHADQALRKEDRERDE